MSRMDYAKPREYTLGSLMTVAASREVRDNEIVFAGTGMLMVAILKEALSNGCGTIAVGRRGVSDVEEFEMGRVAGKLTQIGRTFAIWVVC
mgnify:CR=1 FL=1